MNLANLVTFVGDIM